MEIIGFFRSFDFVNKSCSVTFYTSKIYKFLKMISRMCIKLKVGPVICLSCNVGRKKHNGKRKWIN